DGCVRRPVVPLELLGLVAGRILLRVESADRRRENGLASGPAQLHVRKLPLARAGDRINVPRDLVKPVRARPGGAPERSGRGEEPGRALDRRIAVEVDVDEPARDAAQTHADIVPELEILGSIGVALFLPACAD